MFRKLILSSKINHHTKIQDPN